MYFGLFLLTLTILYKKTMVKLSIKRKVETIKFVFKSIGIIILFIMVCFMSGCVEGPSTNFDPNDLFDTLPAISSDVIDETKVSEVRDAYDKLTAEQKEKVFEENLKKLEELESKISEINAEKIDSQIALDFIKYLENIETSITKNDDALLTEAKTKYDELTTSQKEKAIDAEAILTRIETKLLNLQEDAKLEEALSAFKELVITNIEDVTKEQVQEVRSAYDALSEENKAMISSEDLEVLVQAEQLIESLEKVQEFIIGMNNLPKLDEVTLDSEELIINLRTLYNSYTKEERTLINGDLITLLMDYEIKLVDLNEQRLIDLEEKIIKEVPAYLATIIPVEISDNITLPTNITLEGIDFNLYWSTGTQYLTNKGVLTRPFKDTNITLSARITGDNFTENYSINVVLIGLGEIQMPEIKEGQMLTFAYLRNKDGDQDVLYNRDYEKLDVINYSFAKIINGKLSISSLTNLNKLLTLRQKGVRIVITVDGVSNDTATAFMKASETPSARTTFANSLLEIADKYQVDGFDLDWEIGVNSNNFVLLCKEIKRVFATYNRKLLLTAAVGVATGAYSSVAKDLANYLDYLHIMCYGMGSTDSARFETALYSGSYATYSVDYAVKKYIAAGFPASKITFGIQFYVRMVTLSGSPVNPLGVSSVGSSSISYTSFVNNYYSKNRSLEVYNVETGSYYWYDGTTFASYDNPASIALKCQYAKDAKIAGVMYWDYGHDLSGTLLDAIYKQFKYNQE